MSWNKPDYPVSPTPEWLTIFGASIYSGLSKSLIYELIDDDLIVSATVLRPGRKRGRRLIQRRSLDEFIESCIGQKSFDNTRPAEKQEGKGATSNTGGCDGFRPEHS
ncbi:hypothetical protein [Roseibacillus persicicus]|uniref:hypothetical protein n=1 Tax=Roseibacillus persicicus TaxID=454148 RepID=UPI00280EDF2F|nr:hypothetical protein [Roseibacillus persicicus]MDQ8191571.1 hypothetical protein [Roseibacillus persicicus]